MNDDIELGLDPVEESNMIWKALNSAHNTALKLTHEISDFMLACEQAKHLKIPRQQLQDMQLVTQVKYLQLHLQFVLNRLSKN